MPNTTSAKRALRQSQRRKVHNLRKRRELLRTIKDYKKTIGENIEEAVKKLPVVYKKLDKAAQTNLIKKGKADRLKSRLAQKVSKKEPTPAQTPSEEELNNNA